MSLICRGIVQQMCRNSVEYPNQYGEKFNTYVDYFCNTLKHRGKILENVARNSKISLAKIARTAGYDRTSIYNHFKEDDLDFGILIKYGKAIGHDFTNDFPEMSLYLSLIPDSLSDPQNLTINEALQQIDFWRSKYINLLERYNDIIVSQLSQ
jgi:hypothetical protein